MGSGGEAVWIPGADGPGGYGGVEVEKERETVSFIRAFAREAHESGRGEVPLCVLDALLHEYGRLREEAAGEQAMADKKIVDSLLDQARDKAAFIQDGDPDCIFRRDVAALLAAVDRLRRHSRQEDGREAAP